MFISTQSFRFNKAIEHFYYALLFSSDDYAAAGATAWDSWLAQGFDLSIKAAPPAVRKADRLIVDWLPGRTFEVTATSYNSRTLGRLSELLQEVERARTNLPSGSEEARAQALLDNPAIESRLRPIRENLKLNALPATETDATLSMIKQGLSALTNGQIKSAKIVIHQ